MGLIARWSPLLFHRVLDEGRTPQTGVGADDLAVTRERFQAGQRRRPFVAVLIIIISTLTLQVRQVLFLTLSVFPKCKKYSISEV